MGRQPAGMLQQPMAEKVIHTFAKPTARTLAWAVVAVATVGLAAGAVRNQRGG